ncbi:unnamed protein product [Leptosia nina]|uniref:Uncharacterized protein n=1 Tax=Leptosia nina TaxID=320188 RepID=A0AAV1K213_9NEOP
MVGAAASAGFSAPPDFCPFQMPARMDQRCIFNILWSRIEGKRRLIVRSGVCGRLAMCESRLSRCSVTKTRGVLAERSMPTAAAIGGILFEAEFFCELVEKQQQKEAAKRTSHCKRQDVDQRGEAMRTSNIIPK